jgi:rod shape-determining protein MreB
MVTNLIIDLGSENIKIYKCGDGLVLNEPSVALVDKRAKTLLLKETGRRAVRLAADSLGGAVLVRPIKNAAVADEELAALLLKDFFKKMNVASSFSNKLRVVALVGCGLAYADRRAAEIVLKKSGVSEVYIIDGLFALASYANVKEGFFVDIGGAVTDAGFVSDNGIIAACQADMGGAAINDEICGLMYSKYAMQIGERTAEKIKRAAAGLRNRPNLKVSVSGKNAILGDYRSVMIAAGDVAACVRRVMDKLVPLIDSLLSSLPGSDYNLVCENGIFLSGGTSRIDGLPEYLAEKLKLKVRVIKEYEIAAVEGGARFLEQDGLLDRFV